jgi:hypothetical protein
MGPSVNVDIYSVRRYAHHGRRWDGNLDNFAVGGVDKRLQILEVFDLDRLVVSINWTAGQLMLPLDEEDHILRT